MLGDFLLDRSKDGTTQDLHTWGFYFAFLYCLHSTVLQSFPWTRLLAHPAHPLLSHCHRNTKSPTHSPVSCPRLSDLLTLEAFTAFQCLLIEYPITLPRSQNAYFEQPQSTKKGQAPQTKEVVKQMKRNSHLISWGGCIFFFFFFLLWLLLKYVLNILVFRRDFWLPWLCRWMSMPLVIYKEMRHESMK